MVFFGFNLDDLEVKIVERVEPALEPGFKPLKAREAAPGIGPFIPRFPHSVIAGCGVVGDVAVVSFHHGVEGRPRTRISPHIWSFVRYGVFDAIDAHDQLVMPVRSW